MAVSVEQEKVKWVQIFIQLPCNIEILKVSFLHIVLDPYKQSPKEIIAANETLHKFTTILKQIWNYKGLDKRRLFSSWTAKNLSSDNTQIAYPQSKTQRYNLSINVANV